MSFWANFLYFCAPLRQIEVGHNMNKNLEQVLLEAAKGYLKSLSNEEMLALTCNLTTLHDELIRLVYHQAIIRCFRAPLRVTADIFLCSKRNISKYLGRKREIS